MFIFVPRLLGKRARTKKALAIYHDLGIHKRREKKEEGQKTSFILSI